MGEDITQIPTIEEQMLEKAIKGIKAGEGEKGIDLIDHVRNKLQFLGKSFSCMFRDTSREPDLDMIDMDGLACLFNEMSDQLTEAHDVLNDLVII